MNGYVTPRLILSTFLLLTTERLPVSGRYLEDDNGFLSVRLSNHPQIYGLYLEPTKESESKFRDITPEKRSRLFVGKRFPAEDEDYVVLSSSDSGSPYVGEEFKRNHLFVGKRGSPRFVGKRSVAGLLGRVKRSAQNEEYGRSAKEPETDDYMWKASMNDGDDGRDSVKRSRMFVGKRRESDEMEENTKRSRLFVGRRGELESEKEIEGAEDGFSVEMPEEADKRSRLFVGKRPRIDHHHQKKKWVENDHVASADKGENVDNFQSPETSQAPQLDKRPRLFPGKRPAPGFVGKRETQE